MLARRTPYAEHIGRDYGRGPPVLFTEHVKRSHVVIVTVFARETVGLSQRLKS